MKLSILASARTMINHLMDPIIQENKVTLFILGQKNHRGVVEKYMKEENINNAEIVIELENFFQSTNHLLIDINDKAQLLHLIRKWSEFHKQGILILRSILEIGLSDKIDQWLKRKGKYIDVFVYPAMYDFKCNTGSATSLLLGGDFCTESSKYLRKSIARHQLPILLNNRAEIEITYAVILFSHLLKQIYINDLVKVTENLGVDIENIKKGLPPYMKDCPIDIDRIKATKLIKSMTVGSNVNYTDNTMVQHTLTQFQKLNKWMYDKLRMVIEKSLIMKIAIIEPKKTDIKSIKKIASLPIDQIHIYTKYNDLNIPSKKVKYTNDLYIAIKNADVLVVSSYDDRIAAISLNRLASLMNQKIIIDSINLFEWNEIRDLNWTYISKGRYNAYIHNK